MDVRMRSGPEGAKEVGKGFGEADWGVFVKGAKLFCVGNWGVVCKGDKCFCAANWGCLRRGEGIDRKVAVVSSCEAARGVGSRLARAWRCGYGRARRVS
eukprot:365398-Chlamydomonas_euryale.AAC.4